MKGIKIVFCLILTGVVLFGQNTLNISAFVNTSYGQMLYWKALNLTEKKVFIHSYLYRSAIPNI